MMSGARHLPEAASGDRTQREQMGLWRVPLVDHPTQRIDFQAQPDLVDLGKPVIDQSGEQRLLDEFP